ncbi:MAG: hypothetical protein COA79_20790 [Planctomycetota bacterium]|nr:MAG: hypothetical protein COA79_20790 [Planctomycetota bacterium]
MSNINFHQRIIETLSRVSEWRGVNLINSKNGLLVIFSIINVKGYRHFLFLKSYLVNNRTIGLYELNHNKKTVEIFKLNSEDKYHIKIKFNKLSEFEIDEFEKGVSQLLSVCNNEK